MAIQDKNILVINGGAVQRASSIDSIRLYRLLLDNGANVAGGATVTGAALVDRLLSQSPILDLGFGNNSTTAAAGGLTLAMNRTATFTAGTVPIFTAGVNPATPPTFTYNDTGASTLLVAGDIVAITGATYSANNGLVVVASVDQAAFPQVVTIKSSIGGGAAPSGSVPFVLDQFTSDTGNTASAYKVDLATAVFADGTASFKDPSGNPWPKGTLVTAYATNAVESDFTGNGDYDTAAQTSLQEAYNIGNTIDTAALVDIVFNLLSGGFTVNGPGSIDFGFSGSTLGAFQVAADAVNLTSNTSEFSISGPDNQASAVRFDAGGKDYITLDSTNNAEQIKFHQFLNFSGQAGLPATAGAAITAGNVVYINDTSGKVTTSSNNAGSDLARTGYAVAVTGAAADGDSLFIATIAGTLVHVTGLGAATVADLGKPVYLGVSGDGTLTAPDSSGTTVWRVGYLHSVPGASRYVLLSPQLIAKIL